MAETGKLYLAEWWDPDPAEEGDRVALEVNRTEEDEIGITVRGLDGAGGHGSLFLTVANARALADELLGKARGTWEQGQ